MAYEVIERRLTRGDSMTIPGGIALWKASNGMFAASHFTRDPGETTPRCMFWSHYAETEAEARLAYNRKLSRASVYATGGSLIPPHAETDELAGEICGEIAA